MPVGSPIEFTFTDDPQWRAAIYSISSQAGEVLKHFRINPGNLTAVLNYGPGKFDWKIKATGYEDVEVTVVSQ